MSDSENDGEDDNEIGGLFRVVKQKEAEKSHANK